MLSASGNAMTYMSRRSVREKAYQVMYIRTLCIVISEKRSILSESNIKVTTPEDIWMMETLLKMMEKNGEAIF